MNWDGTQREILGKKYEFYDSIEDWNQETKTNFYK